MVRYCIRSSANAAVTMGLFTAYIASLMAVNAAVKAPRHVPLMQQVVNVGALALLLAFATLRNYITLRAGQASTCSAAKTWSWLTLILLVLNLVVRFSVTAAKPSAYATRWDTTLAVFGTVAVLAELYYALVPRARGRTTLFACLLVFALPLVAAVPTLFSRNKPDARDLQAALDASQRAYDAYDGTDHDTRVVSFVRDGVVYVGFAGTESKQDWKIDFNIGTADVPREWLRPADPRVTAHKGFVKLYADIRDQVLTGLKKSVHKVVVCGHSLGGALATVAALDLASTTDKEVHMYSFGAPGVGDAAFSALYRERVTKSVRVYNAFDPIPRGLSSQFLHPPGGYAVSSGTSDDLVPTTAHYLQTYRQALARPTWRRVLGLFAPLAYVLVALVLVLVVRALVAS